MNLKIISELSEVTTYGKFKKLFEKYFKSRELSFGVTVYKDCKTCDISIYEGDFKYIFRIERGLHVTLFVLDSFDKEKKSYKREAYRKHLPQLSSQNGWKPLYDYLSKVGKANEAYYGQFSNYKFIGISYTKEVNKVFV